jgi:RNA polymerase primary sigma factor
MSTSDANWYSKQIKRVPMLTAAEEITLGTQVQNWLNDPEPSPALVRRGRRAQNRMVEANLRLVVTVANKYSRQVPASDFMDLVQAGNIGLVRAVEKYDPTRGYKFSTYAYWWIRQGISRHCELSVRTIRLPSSTTQKLHQIATTTRRLVQELHRNPSKTELAEALDITTADLELLLTRSQACLSLDAHASGDGTLSTIGELVADPSIVDLDDEEESNTMAQMLGYVSQLEQRQRALIEGTLGIGQSIKTISKLAKELGINPAQASKLLRDAKMRLRWLANTHPKPSPLPPPTPYVDLNQLELTNCSFEITVRVESTTARKPRKKVEGVVQPSFW